MPVYALAQLTQTQLHHLFDIDNRDVDLARWQEREGATPTDEEQAALANVRRLLLTMKIHLANEATVWGRAIYPLLALAERDLVRAFAQVSLQATVAGAELRGEVDGVLAHVGIGAEVMPPYLVVVEAKRGVEGSDPVAQLVGGLVCAAWQNHQRAPRKEHRLYGVYTIADVWTFAEMRLVDIDAPRPKVTLTFSREYTEKDAAATILSVLKSIVAEFATQ